MQTTFHPDNSIATEPNEFLKSAFLMCALTVSTEQAVHHCTTPLYLLLLKKDTIQH